MPYITSFMCGFDLGGGGEFSVTLYAAVLKEEDDNDRIRP